jgi:predicted ribosomally synthesized peptide with nif11-like leader
MSEEQLKAFWEAVQADEDLQEKLQGAADLDAFLAIAKEAGFNISKADWLEYQANQTLELSDEELESVTGGFHVCIWMGIGRDRTEAGRCRRV